MTKQQLVKWSMARDVLDWLVIGQIPPLNWILDAPILYLHLRYAGPKALIVLLELIPVVGLFPFFTAAALSYADQEPQSPSGPARAREGGPVEGFVPPRDAHQDFHWPALQSPAPEANRVHSVVANRRTDGDG